MPSGPRDENTVAVSSPGDSAQLVATRFTPGVVIGDRYRMVSLLGAGGMGEIYRADDLKLGQRVALKWVPPDLTGDKKAFERLCAEVRIARQVSHPNVCRVFDMVLAEGQYFISMEFIEGEDLASLLRRIGRLAPDKALAVAQNICAGLAAAHDRGVVHRDLKPANVMIDGRGNALIADFGLASAVADLRNIRDISGTPAYMAPEQMHGGEITLRTDIYALGLILYEIFTGKRVFQGETFDSIRSEHAQSKRRPSSIVHEIDPTIERLILKCIDEEPAQRPPSAHAVLAALPGGDALDAAVAAGETPSPEMVAAAGVTGNLSVPAAWSLFAAGVVALVLCYITAALWTVPGVMRGAKSRDVLEDRATEIIDAFGYPAPADEAIRFQANAGYLRHLAAHRADDLWTPHRTRSASPTHFAYRGSPRVLVPANADSLVTLDDPPEVIPTMSTLVLDHRGRLRSFRIVPPEKSIDGAARVYDWRRAFEFAALDIAAFKPVASEWVPRYGFDRRHAWTGVYPDERDIAIRVEAASLGGRPVSFRVIEPWTTPRTPEARQTVAYFAFGLMTFIAFIGGAVIARRNHRRGRGDLRGARRIAAAVLIGAVLARVLWMNHVADLPAEWELIVGALSTGLMRSLTVFLLYLAAEPYVRRRWPRMLISWNRVVAGRLRDPLVSRDVVIGVSVGALTGVTARSSVPVLVWLGWTDIVPTDPLLGPQTRSALAFFAGAPASFVYALTATLVVLTILLIFAFILRSYLASMIVTGVMLSAVFATGNVPVPANALSIAIGLWVLHRFGAVAYSAMIFVQQIGIRTPFTFELDAWYGPGALAVGLLLVAWLAVSFYWSLAGKPLFGAAALEDVPAT